MSRQSGWSLGIGLCLLVVLGLTRLSCAANPPLGPGADDSPYHVGPGAARLTTPQWVGEPGVEAVVIFSIDDMTNNLPKYETFLQPLRDRLKKIDGRAPISILTCQIDPVTPGLQRLLKEGMSFEIHTTKHPCPLLQKGDFAAAAHTYHDCVDMVGKIPNTAPVAFRMPCCDSQNTVSPRFFAEIFNRTSPAGRSLTIDSSVFTILTPNDPALPREAVLEPDGSERFRKYLLKGRSFVNLIENYPYPYTIRRLAWEFPCIVPSDWEAQNTHRPNNPKTTEDLKAALDGVVAKQGVFTLVFHPHGWIKAEQLVELVDHAVARHGSKVKFLNFKEAQERLNRHLLQGHPLRTPNGQDGGVRLADVNNDGNLDVLIGDGDFRRTRVWDSAKKTWTDADLPAPFVRGDSRTDAGTRLGRVLDAKGRSRALLIAPNGTRSKAWIASDAGWTPIAGEIPAVSLKEGRDNGLRFVDIDQDGSDELIVANPAGSSILRWSAKSGNWTPAESSFPAGLAFVDTQGRDGGLRLVDLDEDGFLDLVFSNESREAITLFDTWKTGWSRAVFDRTNAEKRTLPPFVKGSEDQGAWFANRHLWIQNEHTSGKPDLVDRRSFNTLLEGVEPRGKSAKAALKAIQVQPGFRVEQVAAEPLVQDPIAFDWGADLKLWVVEMGDYPLGLDGKGKSGGVVRILEDTNGDGVYDKATTFLDGLPFPTGVMPWRKGVLISAAPDILYAEDTNGDGKADVREVLFTGFVPGNPQHRVNGFAFGLDGWIYAANGDSGGRVRSLKTGKTVAISGRDFRFKPDTGEIETESGQTQYGRSRDDWGRWFGNNNSEWGWQYVLSESDIARNPSFRFTGPKQPLGVPTRLDPISRTLPRFNVPTAANHVTSANSPTPYRDDLFGPAFANALFVSEPVHNLIRRIDLVEKGPVLMGRLPVDQGTREFLASSDNWFRPTSMKTGPDGALWVADMYRGVIEHPEWIPDDWEARIDLRAGQNEGRIYRVVPVGVTPRPMRRLDRLDTAGLVAALDSPNGWTRDTAQRLLQDARDPAAIPALAHLVASSAHAKTRLQALWTLNNLGGLSREPVLTALNDKEPLVRRGAVRVATALATRDTEVARALTARVEDPDPAVRLELACALGNWNSPEAGRALARIAVKDAAEPWIRAAVLTSARPHAATLLTELLANAGDHPPAGLIEPLFASLEAEHDSASLKQLRSSILTPAQKDRFADWQFAALAGLARAGKMRELLADPAALQPIREAILASTADPKASDSRRLAAITALLPLGLSPDDRRERLAPLLAPTTPPDVRRVAIDTLAKSDDPKVPAALLEGWKSHSPATRDQVLDALLSRPAWTASLLSSLEDTCTPPGEIGTAYRDRLLRLADRTLRDRAATVFASTNSPSRQAVIDSYKVALGLKGESGRGAALFQKTCAVCHKFAGQGGDVGPDLSTQGEKPGEALLVALLDPSRAFETRYASFSVELNDGRLFTGLISGESSNAITLKKSDGKEDVLPRSEISAMVGSGRSMMPEGLEKDLNPQAVADLFAYLRAAGSPPKSLAGNRPTLVAAGSDGAIKLSASTAEIRGDSLTFESHYGNLGFWSSANDRAGWSFLVPRSGRYQISLDYACPPDAAGDVLQVELGSRRLDFKVASTGSWDNYQRVSLGEVELVEGETRIDLRPLAKPKSALLDLRAIELNPSR